jgi:predicted 3-demethylubiquinone-9 3-methyltransferase (glyoxalase superfamily)
MAEIRPFLMFQGDAEAALRLYVSLFEDGELKELTFYGAEGPGPQGKVQSALLRIAGQELMALDSPITHAFGFTPSMSLFAVCADEAELDRVYAALSEGGQELMPLGEYGFSRKFGWVNDRFGVSWQLNLP